MTHKVSDGESVPATLALIPMRDAYLCANLECNMIGNDSRKCWACGSNAVLSLQSVIDKKDSVASG